MDLDVAKEELAFHQARLSAPESATYNRWAVATAAHKVASAQFALIDPMKNPGIKIAGHEKAQAIPGEVIKGDLSDFRPSYPGAKWSATRFQFSGKTIQKNHIQRSAADVAGHWPNGLRLPIIH